MELINTDLHKQTFMEIWQRGISLQSHRYKLRSVSNCCIGSEVVDWLLFHDKASTAEAAAEEPPPSSSVHEDAQEPL